MQVHQVREPISPPWCRRFRANDGVAAARCLRGRVRCAYWENKTPCPRPVPSHVEYASKVARHWKGAKRHFRSNLRGKGDVRSTRMARKSKAGTTPRSYETDPVQFSPNHNRSKPKTPARSEAINATSFRRTKRSRSRPPRATGIFFVGLLHFSDYLVVVEATFVVVISCSTVSVRHMNEKYRRRYS